MKINTSSSARRKIYPFPFPMKYYFLLALLFLTGCTSFDTLRHESFTMAVPSWKQQSIVEDFGIANGFFSTNGDCIFNLSISREFYLQVTQPFFQRLRLANPQALLQYDIFESLVLLHYELPNGRKGDARILACPSGFTYLADFSCSTAAYERHHDTIISSLDSMDC